MYKKLQCKLKTAWNNPKTIGIKLLNIISPILSDKLYLRLLFPLRTGYKLNLNNPQTYNEKLQWLKLNYRNDLYPIFVDKYEFKEYARKIIGDEYIIKTYGIWNSFDEIDFNKLPNQFVLKTTHDQGGVVVCKNKSEFDIEKTRRKLNKHLQRRNLYYLMREWPYKYVKPRIIAEELLIEEDEHGLKDYKFYCFHGEPKVFYISYGRQGDKTYLDFYDLEFNKLDIRRPRFVQPKEVMQKPDNYDKMISLARKLAGSEPHVRIDFYNINGEIKLGEFTLFQGGGMMPFYPKKWDYILGEYINLSDKKEMV